MKTPLAPEEARQLRQAKWADPVQRRRATMLLVGAIMIAVPFFGYLFSYQPPDPPRDRTAEACAKAVGYQTEVLARCIATVDGGQ